MTYPFSLFDVANQGQQVLNSSGNMNFNGVVQQNAERRKLNMNYSTQLPNKA